MIPVPTLHDNVQGLQGVTKEGPVVLRSGGIPLGGRMEGYNLSEIIVRAADPTQSCPSRLTWNSSSTLSRGSSCRMYMLLALAVSERLQTYRRAPCCVWFIVPEKKLLTNPCRETHCPMIFVIRFYTPDFQGTPVWDSALLDR